MDRKEYGVMLALAVLAGFVGGAFSNRIFTGPPDVQAQATSRDKVKTTPVQPVAPTLPPAVKQVAPKEGVITVPIPGLAFKTPDGRVLARLSADQYGGGNFTIYESGGREVASISTERYGWGTFTVYNSVGTALARLSGTGSGGLLSMYDLGGRTLAELRTGSYAGGQVSRSGPLYLYDDEKRFSAQINRDGLFLSEGTKSYVKLTVGSGVGGRLHVEQTLGPGGAISVRDEARYRWQSP